MTAPEAHKESKRPRKIRLGDMLLVENIISQQQLEQALAEQRKSGRRLGNTLVELNIISEEQLLRFLARQLSIEYIDMDQLTLKPEIVQKIPEIQARRLRIIALEQRADGLVIGMADPTDVYAYDEITQLVSGSLTLAVVKESSLLKALDAHYRHTKEIKGLADELELQLGDNKGTLQNLDNQLSSTSDAPLIKLLNSMLIDAVKINASDIHIEPEQAETRIRFRVDGVLHEQTATSPRLAGVLISRLKLLAGLDISEKRLPQDGRFNFMAGTNEIDVRISTMPSQHGETAVLRLLNQTKGIPDLVDIGMSAPMLATFRRVIKSPHGLVLVTGPTGSGKTTTLYSVLKSLKDPSKKIITIEDPIEYRIPGITQIQANAKIDLDFARVLRSLLRQDPDIALVGEMRDSETMETALRTAMTGHLVLSTLHTNDAISTVSRLMDMGAAPFLIASSLRGILAQRLVRVLCDNCAQPLALNEAQQQFVSTTLGQAVDNAGFKKSMGCGRCNETGYIGRTTVCELVTMTDALRQPLHVGDIQSFSAAAAQQKGFVSLPQAALQLAAQGVTSFDEAMRVCFGSY